MILLKVKEQLLKYLLLSTIANNFNFLLSKNPPPNNYNLKSEFVVETEKKKGFSIGVARDDMP